MNKRFTLVAAIAALATPALVGAQQVPPPSTTTVVAPEQQGATFGQLISRLHDSSSTVQKELGGLDSLTANKVRVIDVTTIVKGDDLEALDHVIAHHREEIEGLRGVLGSQAVIASALDSSTVYEDASVKDVIALDVTQQGEVLVFVYRPKAKTGTPGTTPPASKTTPPTATTPPAGAARK
jgi:hypothetical protein